MRIEEYNSERPWVNKLLNTWPLCINTDNVLTLLAIALDSDGLYYTGSQSLFYNGFIFIRITWPFGVWLHVKPLRNLRFQCGCGWALNGRFKFTFRFQTDESAAAGVSGRNFNQAAGWNRGTA